MLVGTLFILLVVKIFDQSVNEQQRETTKIILKWFPFETLQKYLRKY